MANREIRVGPGARAQWRSLTLIGVAMALTSTVCAQEIAGANFGRTVNLDSPTPIARSSMRLSGDVRIFGSGEDIAYLNLDLEYGLRDHLEMVLRGAVADRRTFTAAGTAIRHGGND